MSVIKKPDLKIFAQDAKTGEIESFPDILRGWGITLERTAGKPPLEWFNAIGKRVDEWLMYLTQRGVAEWDASLSYPKTAIVQFNSIVYVSVKETKGEQPDKSQASWSTLGLFIGLDKYSTTAAMNLELNKKFDKANISGVKGNDNDKVASLNLFTTEIGKLQPKGNYQEAGYSYSRVESDERYQPKGNYATSQALSDGLNKKFDKENVTQSTGSSTTQVMSQDAATKSFIKPGDFGFGGLSGVVNDSELKQGGVGRFFRQGGGADDGAFGTWGAGYQIAYDSNYSVGVFVAPSTGVAYTYIANKGSFTKRALYNEANTSVDNSGFLRATGSKNALTTDKVTQSIGTSKELVMSQNAVYESLFCSNETWKNMKNERVADTNYTNSTSKPIMVSVQGDAAQVGASVNGITIIAGRTGQDHCSFIVQPGATYSVTCRTILVWAELR